MSKTASIERGDDVRRSDDKSEEPKGSLLDLDEMKDFQKKAGHRNTTVLTDERQGDSQNDDQTLDFSEGDLSSLYGIKDAVMQSHLRYFSDLIDRNRDGDGRGRDGERHHKHKKHHKDGDDDQDTLLFTSPYENDGHHKQGEREDGGDPGDGDGNGTDNAPKSGPVEKSVHALGTTPALDPIAGYMSEGVETTVEPSLYTVQPGQTIEDIARVHLGTEADDVDLQRHIADIVHVNKLAAGERLTAGTKLSLPGHTADGGFNVITSRGDRITNWPGGIKLTERSSGRGTLRLPDGKIERLSANEVDSLRRDESGRITVFDTAGSRSWRYDVEKLREETVIVAGKGVTQIYENDGTVREKHTGPESADNYEIDRDKNGDVRKVVYPDGSSAEFTYDGQGRVATYKDREGVTWTREGDSDSFKSDQKNGFLGYRMRFGDIEVDKDGNVTEHKESDGTKVTTRPDGSQKVDQPDLGHDKFAELLDRNWSRIDKNDDGYLSKEEVDQAVINPNFTGEDAQMVVTLKNHYDRLNALTHTFRDQVGSRGLSRDDVKKLSEVTKEFDEQMKYEKRVADFVTRNFDTFDRNHDGQIAEDELDQVKKEVCLSTEEEELLDHFKDKYDEFRGKHKTVSKEMMAGYTDIVYRSREGKLMRDIDGALDHAEHRLEDQNLNLYRTDDPLDSIKPEAINQGGIGDCYFMSAVASLAATNPQAIKDMIKDNGDGTYTVTFPGDPDNPITVKAPTEAELSLYGHGKGYGIWPSILEKAYGDWKGDTTIPQEAADGGDKIYKGIEILTGDDTKIETIKDHSVGELDRMLTEAFRDDKSVVVNVRDNPDNARGGDLPTHHAYSVIGYDPETQTVTIRNPWGHGELVGPDGMPLHGDNDGIFTVSLEEFRNRFKHIAIQGNEE